MTTNIVNQYKQELLDKGTVTITKGSNAKEKVRLFDRVLRSLELSADQVKATLHNCTIILL